MKAIIIEGVLKFQNNFKEFNGNVGLKYATDQQWYDWGFREYVVPVYTNLQKLGEFYFDTVSDTITYYIVNKTQEELDADAAQAIITAQIAADNDIDATLENKYMEDGILLYRRVKFEIRRRLTNNVITLAQYNSLRRFIHPAILPLNTGDWDIANDNMIALTPPTNATTLAIFNIVKNQIQVYVTDNNIL